MLRFPTKTPRSKFITITAGLVLVVLLGVLDFITGPELSFSVFYLLPITLVTWLTSLAGGVISAIASASTWLIADLLSSTVYSHPLIPFWNAVVRLLLFLIVVSLGSAFKNLNQDLEKRVKDRTALLEEEVAERIKVESRLKEYAKRLEILHEIDRGILAAESLEAIAHSTTQHVQHVLHCDFVSFILFDFETRHFILFEPAGHEKEARTSSKHVPMDEIPDHTSIAESLRQGDVLVTNAENNLPLDVFLSRLQGTQGYHSLMIVPILAQHELIGSLNLMWYQQAAFTPEHQEVGREIANQLGIAINQARMLAQLRADQEKLQALSQRLLDIQETERRDIARELHDEIGQALTSIGVTLNMAIQQQPEAQTSSLRGAYQYIVELMERVSKMSLKLRPALLDDLGLLPALLWHFDRYATQTNIEVHFKHSGLEGRRFAPQVETAAYRIVQEALTNVARHAQVHEAWVTIWYDQNTLGVQVEDRGRGFDADTVLMKRNSGGLFGMQERALLLNGKLIIETADEAGTRLLAEITTTELGKG